MDVAKTISNKRILYVITKANWGGAQKYVYEMACANKNAGFEVVVACGTDGELTSRLGLAGIHIQHIPGLGRDIAPLADLKAFRSLLMYIRRTHPDVVHANSSKAGLLAVLAARIAKTPRIIFTAHGWAFNESRPVWQRAIFAAFHLATVWLSDIIICVSEAVMRDAAWMPARRNKFVVILHGITPEVLEEKMAARAKLALPSSPFQEFPTWIGTLAELHPTKGLDIAIEAFALIANTFPHTSLMLIGTGQDRNRLAGLIHQHHLVKRVHFCGHVENAARYLKAFDIFLFPSHSEALGFAVLEAGLASLPVVASGVGGIPEIITDTETGLLIPDGEINAYAKALSSLLTTPDLRTKLGTALHEKVRTQFTQQQMIEKTLSLY